ncbi:MAG: hypothetical protein V8T40_06875 [Phocaeicola vulgatus]
MSRHSWNQESRDRVLKETTVCIGGIVDGLRSAGTHHSGNILGGGNQRVKKREMETLIHLKHL